MMWNTKDRLTFEDRVVAALSAEGLVRRDRSWRREGGIAALAASIGALGVLGLQALPTGAASDRYLLALYTTPSYSPEALGSQARSEEYGRWAAQHDQGPAVVSGGAELGPGPLVLGPQSVRGPELAGYFLIQAHSRREALALAKTTPHLRHGGTVILHDIVD